MKNSLSDNIGQHFEEWRLAYLENLLTPDETSLFEEHLKKCPECEDQVKDLSRLNTLLKTNKDALCPEEWQLFDYACGREDSTGMLASHLGLCSSCRDKLESFGPCTYQGGVPDSVWQKMKRLDIRPEREATTMPKTWILEWWDKLTNFFSPPLALAGAMAAAILVAVLLYPYSGSTPSPALSTVNWNPNSEALNLMGAPGSASSGVTGNNRLAMILYFKNFKSEPDLEKTDAFYRLLNPGRDVRLQYEIVSPYQVKEAIEDSGIRGGGKDDVLHVLKDKLSVSHALVMEVSEKGGLFSIDARLTNTANGAVVGERKIANVQEANLPDEIGAAADYVLKTKGPVEYTGSSEKRNR